MEHGMNIRRSRPVPLFAICALGLAVALGSCRGPDLSPGAAPLVAGQPPVSPERAAAIAEMRRRGEASDTLPYPGAFQAEQTKRLAARQEPRRRPDAAAIEAELAALAVLRQAATTPEELAELDQSTRVQR
jgi:hypothetical protein